MKRWLVERLARCYPAQWRARYGDEYAALLAECDLRWRDVFDVAAGAWDARWRAAHTHDDETDDVQEQQGMRTRRLLRWLLTLLTLLVGGAALGLWGLSYLVVPPPDPVNMTTVQGTFAQVRGGDCDGCDLVIRLNEYTATFYINRFGHAAPAIQEAYARGDAVTLTVFRRYLDREVPWANGQAVPTMMLAGDGGAFHPEWYNPRAVSYTDHGVHTRGVAALFAGVALLLAVARLRLRHDPRKRKTKLALA